MGIESTSEVWESAPRNHFVRPETTDDGCCTTMAKRQNIKNTGGTCGCYEELLTKFREVPTARKLPPDDPEALKARFFGGFW